MPQSRACTTRASFLPATRAEEEEAEAEEEEKEEEEEEEAHCTSGLG